MALPIVSFFGREQVAFEIDEFIYTIATVGTQVTGPDDQGDVFSFNADQDFLEVSVNGAELPTGWTVDSGGLSITFALALEVGDQVALLVTRGGAAG